ncbi:Tetratricopeptide TPR_1 repeat-containing protein [Thiorhodococcus drewsii AZ1]|uniref:protein O-GlcNAc transferase n=1 Tax=Thiorhodococcus drewsii AZ1 TaxID=765913 RepID=G2DXG9_9GAMM|nr:Tetratricopeptide TPR_1 repeat-containing protein [Thiorhodococcus drewsii AZ1]
MAAGSQARRGGDITTAIGHFRAALELQPDRLAPYNNLANALQETGDLEGALALYRKALELAPDHAVLHCNLGGLWQLKGDSTRALAAYRHAIALQPDLYLGHYNLAKILTAEDRFGSAEAAYREALRLKPDQAGIHLDCGQLYHRYGFVPKAIERYRAALRLAPSARAYNALGAALQDWGNVRLARASYRRALKLEPGFELPKYNLAQLHDNQGELQAARIYYEQALASTPENIKLRYHLEMVRRKQADWSDAETRLETLSVATERYLERDGDDEGPPLLGALAFALPPSRYRALAERISAQLSRQARALADPFEAPPEPGPDPLRIGYLSPDFRCHAVGTLIAGLFEHHRRSDVEIHAYSLTPVRDEWTERVRAGCDHFSDVSLKSPLEIARRIHGDGIHILVDLAGYTTHSRPLVLALRPAPVQIQFLGYPGTLGADYVTHIIADRHLIPPEHEPFYRERIVRLPNAWASAPPSVAEPAGDRAACGLPESAMVYCCLNGIYKIESGVFALWMRILERVPESVLWLLDGGESGSNARLREAARTAGIDPDRLIFAPKRAHAEYLAHYRLADLFLDTLVYNAGATAVGALAAGLPVLTCPGGHYAARMGASLSHAVGLPELVCASPEDYVEQAVALGRDPTRRAELKRRLAAQLDSAPLFDPGAFVAELEAAYRRLWEEYLFTTAGHSGAVDA